MPAFLRWKTIRYGFLSVALTLLLWCGPAWGQRSSQPNVRLEAPETLQTVNVIVGVRDERGQPLELPASVQLHSKVQSYNVTSATQKGGTASFPNVLEGDYEIEVRCPGCKTTTTRLNVTGFGANLKVYVYVQPESEAPDAGLTPSSTAMTPKMQTEMERGVELMRKRQYESAKEHFRKAAQLAPANPEVFYLLGSAELAQNQIDLARKDFERALALAPNDDRFLIALGELELQAGETNDAIATLEKAYRRNGAGWRTHLLLASAYANAGLLQQAESHAASAATLAREKGAAATLFLGDTQYAVGKWEEAKQTWERVLIEFPTDPAEKDAKRKLELAAREHPADQAGSALTASTVVPPLEFPEAIELPAATDRPWAPPDIDSREYEVATDVPCTADEILARGMHRVKAQLENFEKFTATEHIEHQVIDRKGHPGPVRERDFSYIVFVHPFEGDSLYLEENRDGGTNLSAFPTSLATTGLNSLGVSVLQPAYQQKFNYRCEGLTSLRGQAAWQIRFEEKLSTRSGVRQWQRKGIIYNIPIKGRIWMASTSYDVLRIETDLREPAQQLELTRDHLMVDYGPVNFESGNTTLWLPWSADMYMELHGRRYHHKHFLTDYLLFAVDTTPKVSKPNQALPTGGDSSP
jgi:tetratricopeptide (TPR) repeat protein